MKKWRFKFDHLMAKLDFSEANLTVWPWKQWLDLRCSSEGAGPDGRAHKMLYPSGILQAIQYHHASRLTPL